MLNLVEIGVAWLDIYFLLDPNLIFYLNELLFP